MSGKEITKKPERNEGQLEQMVMCDNFNMRLSMWQKIKLFFAKKYVVCDVDVALGNDASVETTFKKIDDIYVVVGFRMLEKST